MKECERSEMPQNLIARGEQDRMISDTSDLLSTSRSSNRHSRFVRQICRSGKRQSHPCT